jgi:putative flippase GtrA
MSLLTSSATAQLIRYGVVGVANNLSLYLGYLLIVYFGCNTKISMTLMYLLGVITAYTANYKWTFSQKNNRGALMRYLKMHITGYLINLLTLYFFVDILHYPHEIVQILAILTVAVFGFVACKFFVFRSESK